jgi:hypothetical protein
MKGTGSFASTASSLIVVTNCIRQRLSTADEEPLNMDDAVGALGRMGRCLPLGVVFWEIIAASDDGLYWCAWERELQRYGDGTATGWRC